MFWLFKLFKRENPIITRQVSLARKLKLLGFNIRWKNNLKIIQLLLDHPKERFTGKAISQLTWINRKHIDTYCKTLKGIVEYEKHPLYYPVKINNVKWALRKTMVFSFTNNFIEVWNEANWNN